MKKSCLLIKIFLIAFSFTIIFSIIIFQIFYRCLDKYNDTRLDPLRMPEIKIDTAKKYDYVLIGDSHVQYWSTGNNSLNLGMTGQTSEQIKLKYLLLKDEIKSGKKLIISVGANDVKSIATNPGNKEEIIKKCVENLQLIISENKNKFDRIYVITIPPDFQVSFPYNFINYEDTFTSKLKINEEIRKTALKNKIGLIDTYEIFKNKTGNEYSIDGVHMNVIAYKILNEKIR
ncbi:hypothetical protein DD829_13340 [Chryseobacterium sp. HMWF035]|nr:hypothetical protein DD829_13340 [Chryseobacterium sp. HMWF035]